MVKYLSTDRVKQYLLGKLDNCKEDLSMYKRDLHFEKGSAYKLLKRKAIAVKLPGRYIFADKKGYHYEEIEIRGELYRRIYNSVEELAYVVCRDITWEYALFNKKKGEETTIQKQLELLKQIDFDMYIRKQKEIEDNNFFHN